MVKLSIYEIALFVLITIIMIAVWVSRPPSCKRDEPKGPSIGSVVRISGCE